VIELMMRRKEISSNFRGLIYYISGRLRLRPMPYRFRLCTTTSEPVDTTSCRSKAQANAVAEGLERCGCSAYPWLARDAGFERRDWAVKKIQRIIGVVNAPNRAFMIPSGGN
jgi:hypothetical protein